MPAHVVANQFEVDGVIFRECTMCGVAKPLTEFHKGKKYRDGRRSECKPCHHVRQAKQRDRDPESPVKNRGYRIKHKFGLTLEEYDARTAMGCAICGATQNLGMDHDHSCCPGVRSCGKCLRECLCDRHNQGLGLFRDNVAELTAAIAYLQRHSG